MSDVFGFFTYFELTVLGIVFVWIMINYKFFMEMFRLEDPGFETLFGMPNIKKSIIVFFIRFIASFLVLSKMELLPEYTVHFHGMTIPVNLGLIIFALFWIPEIIALIQWGIIFSVFALAGLGAAIVIDIFLFPNMMILFGKLGPVSIITIILIAASFRYFSNYSIKEIVKMAKKIKVLWVILLLAGVSYMLIGGGILWRLLLRSHIYRDYLSRFLSKVETFTAAYSVIIILLVFPLQFTSMPLLFQILIAMSTPVAMSAVAYLLITNKFRAWREVFEVYTEEFSSQSLILKKILGPHRKRVLLMALIGNWAAIPVAIYDVGLAIYWIFQDILIVAVVIIILTFKYVSSMIEATREIIATIRLSKLEEEKTNTKANDVNST